jgi:hypothetical protein
MKIMRLTDVCKEITDLAPFDKGWGYLLKDKRLIRYLILALPFHENVIESVMNSLLFKFQCKRQFLIDFEENLNSLLQLSDPATTEEQLLNNAPKPVNIRTTDEEKGEMGLNTQVNSIFVPEVRINVLKMKQRCIYYMRKLYFIYETVSLSFLTRNRIF